MADDKNLADGEHTEGGEAEFSEAEPAREEFFDKELARYEAILDRSNDEAFERFGFTMYHSLSGLKQVELRQKMGFETRDSVDLFNLAGLSVAREDYKGAAQLLEKAVKQDENLADARYNLALCYERLDRKSDALKNWEEFLKVSSSEEDKAAVSAHLAELRG